MSDLELITISDMCSSIDYGFTTSAVQNSIGPRFLRITDIVGQGIRWSEVPFCAASPEEHSKYRLEDGDVVIARTGATTGYSAYISNPPDAVFASYLVRLKTNSGNNPRFLSYALKSRFFWDHIYGVLGEKSAQPNASASTMTKASVPRHSLKVQVSIARVLGTLDDKIELLRQTNETLEAMARALFKSWFVDFDPVHKKAAGLPTGLPEEIDDLFPIEFEDSELGEIPKGWRVKRLYELTSKIGSGATPRGGQSVYVEIGTSLIRSQNIYDSEFVWDGLARISEDAAKQLDNVTVREEDVLINITGASILRTCVVLPSALPARVNQHVSIIRAMSGVPCHFLHEFLLLCQTKELLLGMNAGASREAVTKAHLESLQLPCPPSDVLQAFEELSSPIYDQMQRIEAEGRSLGSLRDSLLPKLISGELELADDMITKILEPAK